VGVSGDCRIFWYLLLSLEEVKLQTSNFVCTLIRSIATKLLYSALGYYLDGWLSADRWTTSVCTRPLRSTQPSIPLGKVNRAVGGLSVVLLSMLGWRRICFHGLSDNHNTCRVLTSLENLENLEISGNFVNLENSGKTQRIWNVLREFLEPTTISDKNVGQWL